MCVCGGVVEAGLLAYIVGAFVKLWRRIRGR